MLKKRIQRFEAWKKALNNRKVKPKNRFHEVDYGQNSFSTSEKLERSGVQTPQLSASEFDRLIEKRDIPQEWYEAEEDNPF